MWCWRLKPRLCRNARPGRGPEAGCPPRKADGVAPYWDPEDRRYRPLVIRDASVCSTKSGCPFVVWHVHANSVEFVVTAGMIACGERDRIFETFVDRGKSVLNPGA